MKKTKGRFYKPFTLERFKARYVGYRIIEFNRKKEKHLDFSIIFSTCQHLFNQLRNFDAISTSNSNFDVFLDDKKVVVAIKVPEVIGEKTLRKMSLEFTEAVEAFKAKHENWFVKSGFICAEVLQKITRPLDWFIEQFYKKLDKVGYVYE